MTETPAEHVADAGPSEIVVEAVVIRGPNSEYGPEGQVEDIGEIARWAREDEED